MKNSLIILLFLFCSSLSFAQNKVRIKGSKKVITALKDLNSFKKIEVGSNLEIFLEKGEKPALKVDADENLHPIITIIIKDSTLYLNTTKDPYRYKKLALYVTYTNDLNLIIAKDQSIINAIQEIQKTSITLKAYNDSQLFINANTSDFVLEANDKTKTELNLKSEKGKVILSQNASLKTLVRTEDFACDMYQKTEARIEGNSTKSSIRLDNNARLTGSKFTIKDLELIAESNSNCSINVESSITISANGKSEIQLLGKPKIEINNFSDEAKLLKKTK
ncbi:GIN domain-containing protein [Flavobacterium faecale]|uniref:GIN domain-containing protein n=1 Tax=Flavobacterium faecale TaxID=1355330 RepID=UPI003AAA53B6